MAEDKKIVKKTDTDSRRKLLKTLVAGGGAVTTAKLLPEQWKRPIVDSIMIPAHAQTSGDPVATGPFTATGPLAMMSDPQNSMLAEDGISEELLDFFVPAAHADYEWECIDVGTINALIQDPKDGDSYVCAYNTKDGPIGGYQIDSVKLDGTPPKFSGGTISNTPIIVRGGTFEGGYWKLEYQCTANSSIQTKMLGPGGTGCTD